MARLTSCLALMIVLAVGCSTERPAPVDETPRPAATPPVMAVRESYRVLETLPHDVGAFTQGLVVHNGLFIESTGQNGQSTIRHVAIATGKVRRMERLEERYFGEGMTVLGGKAYMLTWLTQTGFVFDVNTLKQLSVFTYQGEGWGLTNDGTNLIMSNGTNMLVVIDPTTNRVVRTVNVTLDGRPLPYLNELEWIEGQIWANIWRTNDIVRIDPTTGHVIGVIDCTGILPQSAMTDATDVMNGIAYDSTSKAIYVTGKNWPHVYRIEAR
ncbi:MAG: glutaminyl-peptide cyclotransferase [Candidatus Kapabacteria bacterium]|nr:glutaminyl-peptide cyclotransferase [Candidatus Kapabacteria bacterium]